jgi:hypothetical protein
MKKRKVVRETLAEQMLPYVRHERHCMGIANPDSVGYVRFNYACKPECPRCHFERLLARKRRKGTK